MEGKEGKIYILRNSCFRDAIVKIGRTGQISEKRAKEISGSTGVPSEFEVLYEEDVFDTHTAEKLIHSKLKDQRVNVKREFFELPLKTAVKVVFETCLEVNRNCSREASTRILIAINENSETLVQQMTEIFSKFKGGNMSVHFLYESKNAKALLKAGKEWDVVLSPELINELKKLKGISYVFWTSRGFDNRIKSSF